MNEAQTRFNKIDPKLRDAGWGIVPGSKILVEQSAYITPTLVTESGFFRTFASLIIKEPTMDEKAPSLLA